MEDSYTVHRRRKAAARRREKTPEPPKRRQDDVTETDDDEDTRARMERMVQETEILEALEDKERRRAKSEKISENIDKSKFPEDKCQRVLKRATSPEVRRRDEENCEIVKNLDEKIFVQVSKREISEKSEKEGLRVETGMTSGIVVTASTEVDKRAKVHNEETTIKPKNNDRETTTEVIISRDDARHRRRDVDKVFSTAESLEKSTAMSIGKKVSSPVIERSEKNQSKNDVMTNRYDECSREVGGSSVDSRQTASKAIDEVERGTMHDENRYEAVSRETGVEAGRSVRGKSLKMETNDRQDTRKNETDEGTRSSEKNREISSKSTRQGDEKVRKLEEAASNVKMRNFETRGSTTTTSNKRSCKLRDNDRTGYTTDSSENEETTKILARRKKSPEGGKLRINSGKKVSSRSRPTTDTDGDPEDQEQRRRNEKKATTRRRPSSETDEDTRVKNRTRSPSNRERRDLSRAISRNTDKIRIGEKTSIDRYADVSDQDSKILVKKSETFPTDTTGRDSTSSIPRSTSEIKKQIIPLSDDSLIEDFERAQRDYMRKERSILDHDPMDDYVDPRMEAALRRRKFSIIQTETEAGQASERIKRPVNKSWFAWLPFFGRITRKAKLNDETEKEVILREKASSLNDREKVSASSQKMSDKLEEHDAKSLKEQTIVRKKVSFIEFFRTLADFASEFGAFVDQNPRETRKIRIMRNRCTIELLIAIIYCGLGAFIFRFTEGAFETFYKCGVKRVKRDFLDSLWNFSHNMREEDWKSMARRKLMEFEEQLHTAHEAGVHSYSGQKSWSFLNAVVYCLTVITTIGYGHISPSTTTGRAITIVYAIFGIPMFLIILADFGKLFTRGIKFLWAFVRRVYYTGSCRRVRRTVPVQEVMKGVQLVYDLATFRRPSQMNPEEIEEIEKQQNQTQTVLNLDGNAPSSAQPDTPGTPALSTFAIDDEFNLPISVAIVILLAYIFVGATVYNFWEQWGFFESFYFVFISMSTIGFGDYVPKHPIYMMLSIVYLVFGLALTSMCINVVQVMLSDSFKQASQKIGATIGFEVTEEDGSVHLATPPTVEIADVHMTIKESESEEQVAPRAKQEDLEL